MRGAVVTLIKRPVACSLHYSNRPFVRMRGHTRRLDPPLALAGTGRYRRGPRWRNPDDPADEPAYRASITLEANPPSVAISDEQTRQQDQQSTNNYDFVATQVGLLGSRAVAERTAQELNLPNNPDVVAQDSDASQRLRAATGVVQGGLKVTALEQGQLIKFSYDSASPQLAALVANGIADSFINTSLQRRYEASAYARNFLERQINKTRADLERSERAVVAPRS